MNHLDTEKFAEIIQKFEQSGFVIEYINTWASWQTNKITVRPANSLYCAHNG